MIWKRENEVESKTKQRESVKTRKQMREEECENERDHKEERVKDIGNGRRAGERFR